MHKYIQDHIYKSRLTITYRTFIDGVPVPEKLPLRILVLGDFSGKESLERKKPLAERRIRSIRKDTKLDSVIEDMHVPLPTIGKDTKEVEVEVEVEGTLESAPRTEDFTADSIRVRLRGTGTSRILSTGHEDNFERQVEFTAEVKITKDEVGENLKIEGKEVIVNIKDLHPDPHSAQSLGRVSIDSSLFRINKEDGVIRADIPRHPRRKAVRTLSGVKGFSPDALVYSYGETRRIRLVQYYLEQLRANMVENRELRETLRGLDSTKLSKLCTWSQKNLRDLMLSPELPPMPLSELASGFEWERSAKLAAPNSLPISIDPTKTESLTFSVPLPSDLELPGEAVSLSITGGALLEKKMKLNLGTGSGSRSEMVSSTTVGPIVMNYKGDRPFAIDDNKLKIDVSNEDTSNPLVLKSEEVQLKYNLSRIGFVVKPGNSTVLDKFSLDFDTLLRQIDENLKPVSVGRKDLSIYISLSEELRNVEVTLSSPSDGNDIVLLKRERFQSGQNPIDGDPSETIGQLAGRWKLKIKSSGENLDTDKIQRFVLWIDLAHQTPSLPDPRTVPAERPLSVSASSSSPPPELQNLLSSFKDADGKALTPVALTAKAMENALGVATPDTNLEEPSRIVNYFAALFANMDQNRFDEIKKNDQSKYEVLVKCINDLIKEAQKKISKYLNQLYHTKVMRTLEANWRGIHVLVQQREADDVVIDLLDVTKEELATDLEDSEADIFGSALFKKIYVDEYDRHGGKPFSAMLGLYEFENDTGDIDWLRRMSRVANASHAPFIAAVSPKFFNQPSMDKLAGIYDLDALLSHPRYGKWNALRNEDSAAYVGLVLPRYLVRKPWKEDDDESVNKKARYTETINGPADYLWGNAAILFGRNMIRSFENSGWCQYIRGPRGGGTVSGLPIHTFERDGREEIQPPIEISIPDYRELQFAKNGFIALVHRKDTADATFFSARSIKKAHVFQAEIDTQNSDLVCNLAYTLSITRIAHYVKRMLREYIGSAADGPYIEQVLDNWLKQYVTTVANPDDLTLLYYPFKATSVKVTPKPGPLGWYKAEISVFPHVQFEGMDVELRLEAALGSGK